MIGVVINPNSRKNKLNPKRRAKIEDAVGPAGRVVVTRRLEEIFPALEAFLDEGHTYWVADGGDGALHWMVNEAAEHLGPDGAARAAVYVPTRGGTIDFLASAIGLKGQAADILGRLRKTLERGREPRIVEVQSIVFEGEQRTRTGATLSFERIAFGNSLAGYGANFFGPFYRSDAGRGPLRIITTSMAAFGTAAARALFPGPLKLLKPSRLKQAEYDYLRPAYADVFIDGEPLCDANGVPLTTHTVIQCASVPLNLGGVFRVFPSAGEGLMHVQAGYVTAVEMARVFPGLTTGRSVDHLVPNAFDGRASEMEIICRDGTTLSPVLDGEIFEGISRLHARMGPVFRMAVP